MKIFDNELYISALCGTIFLITAIITLIFPPKKINSFYGYRTNASMKNQETWDFAQKYSSKIMIYIALIMIVISTTACFLHLTKKQNLIAGLSLLLLSIIALFVIVEGKINKKFNQKSKDSN